MLCIMDHEQAHKRHNGAINDTSHKGNNLIIFDKQMPIPKTPGAKLVLDHLAHACPVQHV